MSSLFVPFLGVVVDQKVEGQSSYRPNRRKKIRTERQRISQFSFYKMHFISCNVEDIWSTIFGRLMSFIYSPRLFGRLHFSCPIFLSLLPSLYRCLPLDVTRDALTVGKARAHGRCTYTHTHSHIYAASWSSLQINTTCGTPWSRWNVTSALDRRTPSSESISWFIY